MSKTSNIKTKLYQMFILGTEGDGYKAALKKGLGGIIFFTKDIKSVEQFKSLISDIKHQAVISPFLSIDQEGGRVERTENIYSGKKYLSAKYAYSKGQEFLKEQTNQIAKELRNFGINLNFAPCIDVNTNPENPIIGERAFSDNPEDVNIAAKIVINAYRENGIIPCVKHFPGHGDANTDSHLTLPKITLTFDELEKNHIKTFKSAIKDNIEMVMIAHLHVPYFETERIPTSLSKNAVSYLRNNLGYKGIIISDDMVMKGVAAFGCEQACEMGIRAGVNMFIYRHSEEHIINLIETLAKKAENDIELKNNIEKSYDLIIKLKQERGV